MSTRQCRDCGEYYTLTADKPGFVYQCGDCGSGAETAHRVRASQAEDEDGVMWYVERGPTGGPKHPTGSQAVNAGLALITHDEIHGSRRVPAHMAADVVSAPKGKLDLFFRYRNGRLKPKGEVA